MLPALAGTAARRRDAPPRRPGAPRWLATPNAPPAPRGQGDAARRGQIQRQPIWAFCVSAGLSAPPRREPRPPTRYVAAVLEVLLAIGIGEGGLLVALHERNDRGEGDPGVEHEP